MRRGVQFCVVGVAAAGLTVASMGCRTSSHLTVRTYEETAPAQTPREQERASEWRMESPGEMQSPGEMETPGTMVVDP